MTVEIEKFLAACRALDFVREEPPDTNTGQAVKAFLKLTGIVEPKPWCAAGVCWAGFKAIGDKWPLPHTAACSELGAYAKKKGALLATKEAQIGDIFLMYYPKFKRFAHTGVIMGPKLSDTWECNTSDDGSREGWGVFYKQRTFGPNDRVIRWTKLL